MGFGSFGDFVLGGASISTAARDDAQAQAQLQEQASNAASTRRFLKIADTVAPKIREMEALSSIPAFQQAAATGVARRGLTGTGLGTAITTAGGGAGELFALSRALDEAARLQTLQVNALLGFAGVPLAGPSTMNLFGQAAENIAARTVSGIFSMGTNIPGAGQNTGAGSGMSGGGVHGQAGGTFAPTAFPTNQSNPFAAQPGMNTATTGGIGQAPGGPGGFPGGANFGGLMPLL